MVISRLVLRNGEDVRVGGGECAHAVDCGVHRCKVFLILLAEFGCAISLSLVRKSHGERRGDGGGYDASCRIGVVEVEIGGGEKLNNEFWIKESTCLLSQRPAARAQNVKGASEFKVLSHPASFWPRVRHQLQRCQACADEDPSVASECRVDNMLSIQVLWVVTQ